MMMMMMAERGGIVIILRHHNRDQPSVYHFRNEPVRRSWIIKPPRYNQPIPWFAFTTSNSLPTPLSDSTSCIHPPPSASAWILLYSVPLLNVPDNPSAHDSDASTWVNHKQQRSMLHGRYVLGIMWFSSTCIYVRVQLFYKLDDHQFEVVLIIDRFATRPNFKGVQGAYLLQSIHLCIGGAWRTILNKRQRNRLTRKSVITVAMVIVWCAFYSLV